MITQVALIWSGGAAATAFAMTGSAIAGLPMHLRWGLLVVLFWPATLPWMCWQLARQKHVAALIRQQAQAFVSPGAVQLPGQWDDTEKHVLEQLGIRVPADVDEQMVREAEALADFFVGRGTTQTHPFATSRALLFTAHAFVLAECELKLREVPQPVPEGYAAKLAATILMTHAHRLGTGERGLRPRESGLGKEQG